LREHTDLPERLIRQLVLTKLQAVGLRVRPSSCRGTVRRNEPAGRVGASHRHGPEILIYDEPFVGLDPYPWVILRLIRRLNDALGITSIVVSHDVHEISTVAM